MSTDEEKVAATVHAMGVVRDKIINLTRENERLTSLLELATDYIYTISCDYEHGLTPAGRSMWHRDDCRRCEVLTKLGKK